MSSNGVIKIEKFDLEIDTNEMMVKWRWGGGTQTTTILTHNYPLEARHFVGKSKDGSAAKDFHKKYGYTAKTLTKVINKSLVRMALDCTGGVKELTPFVFKWKMGGKCGLRTKNVLRGVKDIVPVVKQTIEDGNKNILPFVVHQLQNTQGLRKVYGKGLWKKLCKNSFSRNMLLSGFLPDTVTMLEGVACPSSLIKIVGGSINHNFHVTSFIEWAKASRVVTKVKARELQMFSDVLDMQRKLQIKEAVPLSIKGMKQYHKQLELKIHQLRYSKDKIGSVGKWKQTIEALPVVEGWSVVVYDNRHDILEEGKAMHHCVASYAERVADRQYLVVSIRKDGERHSTLGLRPVFDNGNCAWAYDQHYGVCNRYVDNPTAKAIARDILGKIGVKGGLLATA